MYSPSKQVYSFFSFLLFSNVNVESYMDDAVDWI